jgi:subtilase family serine protease
MIPHHEGKLMNFRPMVVSLLAAVPALVVSLFLPGSAVAADAGSTSRPLIKQKIDETTMVQMARSVHPAATAANDRGVVSNNLKLDHMVLLLQRSPEREAALNAYMESTYEKGNPNYHRWLTAEQLGKNYGPHPSDLEAVTGWLQMHGFEVNRVSKSGMMIDFSGTAGQVLEAFKTEVHNLEVRGERHIGNLQTPRLPAALAPVVVGLTSLNDFRPRPAAVRAKRNPQLDKQAEVRPALTTSDGLQLLTPRDLSTIYNINPLYGRGIDGLRQTVVAIEPTDLYSTADVQTYRKTFLPEFKAGSFHQTHPGGCTDPGLYEPWLFEAAVDIESIMASAPGAKVVSASCASTDTNFGSFIALENLIDEPVPPAIISVSIQECEAGLTESGNRYINYLYQQAAAQGTSVIVSSGDSGAAGCDDFDTQTAAIYGISVNGLASTAYNVAVGGTDYADTYFGTNADYWKTKNSSTYESAKSYIPEIPWNDSCASTLLANFLGYAIPYGSNGLCNSSDAEDFGLLNIVAGSGGPSGCASGETNPNPGTPAVSGTCKGRPKPNWQRGLVGVPSDGVRDLPDVSLFAANGVWGHYYVFCFSDVDQGGAPCKGDPSNWAGGGGTSASAPLMAGIQALVNQKMGSPQGNPNYALYSLARAEYLATGNPVCDSTYGGNSCIFHDVTLGDNDVDCTGPNSCYTPSGTYGVLSVKRSSYQKAYNAHLGWDFATGIGTLNVELLVDNWEFAP